MMPAWKQRLIYWITRLLIQIKEGLHQLGMGAHQGKFCCQAADQVLESQ
jgi:hypothetical protein